MAAIHDKMLEDGEIEDSSGDEQIQVNHYITVLLSTLISLPTFNAELN